MPRTATEESAAEAVAEQGFWYHTLDVAPGVTTPGWFDLRPILARMPWPDVRDKRCLDVGPYDGHLSFELERRGASEVVAADISHPSEWDVSADLRAQDRSGHYELVGSDPGAGFKLAHQLLGSDVRRTTISAYDLNPDELGTFDVVVCGSLLLHLRDPIRALEAMRSVCGGYFLSAEQIVLRTTLLHPRTPLAITRGGSLAQWWLPNARAHRGMVHSAGFELLEQTRPYSIPFGPAHPPRPSDLRSRLRRLVQRLATGGTGLVHSALLARPRL